MCGGAIIAEFIPRTGGKLISAYLWPELELLNWSNRECSCTLDNDDSLLRFVKRTRIASHSRCFNSTLSSINELQPHQDTGWSPDTERSNKRTENHCNNSGKRKLCDRKVNLADNLEYCWPILTRSSDEKDSDETSDSSSDSETYSGPS